ncbi:acyl-CoA-binding protein [Cecembia rubra]|uniref:Acyl-CoA-binding protein n=1 Tax=Cecembia rubra TaxID=1485585 RepID=A0A2P8E9W6_9BACT|nr:acyl-CoA-binding protein [Cecembia rubra]PSL06266.1 acyl-CoA-binding protein [Cecembia rubra]
MKANNLEEAFALTKKFSSKPGNEDLLRLYSYYKQATEGDNNEERPGGFDFIAAAKYNAWANLKGMSKEEAGQAYIALVNVLAEKYI